jgi:xanthine dehydrogenase accessory factor
VTTAAALAATAASWLAQGRPAIEVAVVAARGSVPREAGTYLLVAADEIVGTIGGGQLELQAIAQARQMLAEPISIDRAPVGARRTVPSSSNATSPEVAAHPATPCIERRIALGPTLGQCCGGVVTLRWQPLSADSLARWSAPRIRFDLQLYGAGHVGRAIVALLADIDCRVRWIDQRDSEFPGPSDPAHISRCCDEAPETEVAQAAPGAFFLILTHSHDLDWRIVDAVLRRGDFGWLGLIGSATKRASFASRLAQRGHSAAAIARIACPIGVTGIAGKEPAVIAVAVVAQLLQLSSADGG